MLFVFVIFIANVNKLYIDAKNKTFTWYFYFVSITLIIMTAIGPYFIANLLSKL